MDVKEYIASGVVEMYALGSLSTDEKNEFEQRLLLYPELKEELTNVQAVLENYVDADGRNPRPILRTKILEKINGSAAPEADKKEIRALNSHSLTYKYLIAASLAALVISTFASWFFYSRWNESEDRYISMLKEKNQFVQNYNVMKGTFDKLYGDLMVARDLNSKVFMLMPVDSMKKYQARVYWNKYTREVYLDMLSMPEPGEGKEFQLWSMENGKPVDAGVFSTTGEEGMHRMKNIASSDAWAVTIEPMGGSQAPDLSQVVLKSKSI
jgi:anti-sigma-K factor RskA